MPFSSSASSNATSSDPATWKPQVPAAQIFEEKTWLQGAILSAVAYGVVVTLFFLNLTLLIERVRLPRHSTRRRQNLALIVYLVVMFILSTLTMASQAEMTQLGFIDNRNFPGGPAAFENLMFSIPISQLGSVCFSLMNWFSDCVLLWRCIVIYRSSSTPLVVILAPPLVMLMATFVTGTIYLVHVSRPGSSFWFSETFTLIYGVLCLALNILITLMIAVRLFIHRQRVVKVIGYRHGSQYTTVIAMLVESAFVLDLVVIFFIITFAMGTPLANIPLSSFNQVQSIASFMIIFRVATGTAWSATTMQDIISQDAHPKRAPNASLIQFVGPMDTADSSEHVEDSRLGSEVELEKRVTRSQDELQSFKAS